MQVAIRLRDSAVHSIPTVFGIWYVIIPFTSKAALPATRFQNGFELIQCVSEQASYATNLYSLLFRTLALKLPDFYIGELKFPDASNHSKED